MGPKVDLLIDQESLLHPSRYTVAAQQESKSSVEKLAPALAWTKDRIDQLKVAFNLILNPPAYDQLPHALAINEKNTCRAKLSEAHHNILSLIDWRPQPDQPKPFTAFQFELLRASNEVAKGLVAKFTLVELAKRNPTSDRQLTENILFEGMYHFIQPALAAFTEGKLTSNSSISLAEAFKAHLEHPKKDARTFKELHQYLVDQTVTLMDTTVALDSRERSTVIAALKTILSEPGHQENNLVFRALRAYGLYAQLNALTSLRQSRTHK